jgi:hypothetical protein
LEEVDASMDMTMRFSDWVAFTGLLLGPAIAVLITLAWTTLTERRRRREAILQQLLLSRMLPQDPSFQQAINRVPLEFQSAKVRNKWDAYISASNKADPAAVATQLNDLIQEMLTALGYKVDHAGSILRGGYLSSGFTEQLELHINSLKALVRIADASEKSAAAAVELVKRSEAASSPTTEKAEA